ncbi:glycoside hydrolase family 3 protein [Actinomadura sp. 7K534]|uniref:glycoside hydrolase family 3 protein n=1 Tax=Actinomadura sp. 7K534 TaxID=2530366 RepID=UPI0010429C3E|nr:glycoside hydrolase family 3 protein [Actinomadura sp. 7K534]TDB87739.1 carbohydrate-binding protein [Actinomadura sp. 7K534]
MPRPHRNPRSPGRRSRSLTLVLAAVVAAPLALAAPAAARETLPFRDPGLPVQARVGDLLGRLTLDEKISLLHQYQPAIPRLGIDRFKTGTEALHGVAWSTDIHDQGAVVRAEGTVFPQSVGLGATWDPELLKRVGSVVGTEARGYHAENPDVWGLQLWAPVVNPLRDPRWGRNEEGYSEDPLLTGLLATAYGHGMQGDDPDHLRTAPVLKHYMANNNEIRRDQTSSSLRPRVSKEYDEVPFEMPIRRDAVTGVMTAYNLINGRPATVTPDAGGLIRSWTDRTLFNVTDAGGPNNLVGSQQYFPDLATADAAVLKAGVDSFTTDNTDSSITVNAVKEALSRGLLAESDIDRAAGHILSIRVRLGEFDPGGGPHGRITKDVVDRPAHRAVAREAATEQMVLLKNEGGTLPIASGPESGKVAVVGQLADTLYTDWYSGDLPYEVTPLDGITAKAGAGNVTSSEGVDRIALKDVGTGKYVAGGTGAGAVLKTGPTSAADDTTRFDVFDWGQGVVTLRSAANGKVVGRHNWGDTFANDQDQPNDWFVQQMFKLEEQDDGHLLIRYAGYEKAYDWADPAKTYLKAQDDGTLVLTTKDDAGRFAKDVISSGVDSAVEAAAGADTAVVVVGSMPFINGREDHDRTTMALAEDQSELVRAVRAANPNTVVVVENSYPTTLNWEQANVPAILWTSHAGAETGNALASVLFGDESPSGKLPQTWYRSEKDLPGILEYDIIKNDRTYQYFRGKPLYPFGHGLSYTTFRYGKPRLSSRSIGGDGTVTVTVPVTNTGGKAGDEVVQLYTHQRDSRVKQPLRKLRAFDKVHVEPGETVTARFRLRASDLAIWDVTRGKWTVEKAEHDLLIGSSATDIRSRAHLNVRGETIPDRDLSKPTRAADFDDHDGVELVDESKAKGDAAAGAAGSWLKFADAGLGRSTGKITARVAGTGATAIQVRLDRPDGPVAGTLNVPSTGDKYTYKEITAPLTGARGDRDVYLVFTGETRLSTFSLTR